jgi:hypothetical protein
MTNRWAAAAALACSAAVAACGGSDGANDDRPAQGIRSEAPAQALVSLNGCVSAAAGTNQYVLKGVRFEPRAAGDPHATTTTPSGQGITEGAWVRLEAGDRQLSEFVGQRVTIRGAVLDDGRNTIGTAGSAGVQTPSGDKSQAAAQEHHSDKKEDEMGRIARESIANGTAALVRVQDVKSSG